MTDLSADQTKTNFDSAGDDPKNARAELATNVDLFNATMAHLRASPFLSPAGAPLAIGDGVESSGGSIRVKLNGTSIDRSASGLKVANSGVTATTYAYPSSLTVGADGRLTSVTAGAAPTSGLQFLAALTASASASLDFTSVIDTTYEAFLFVFDQVRLSTDQAELRMRVSSDNGSTWKTTSYNWAHHGFESGGGGSLGRSDSSAAYIPVSRESGFGSSMGNNAVDALGGHLWFTPNGSTKYKAITYQTTHSRIAAAGAVTVISGGGLWMGTTQLNAAQFLPSSGTITSGQIRCYGVKNS